MKKYYSIFLLIFSLFSFNLTASHTTSGELNVKHISGNEYEITFKQLFDCSAISFPAPVVVQLSCGSYSFTDTLSENISWTAFGINNRCDSLLTNSTCNGGSVTNFRYHIYKSVVTIPTCGIWTISNTGCCRYNTVNVSSTASIYIEAKLDNQAFPTNSTPYFPLTPNLYINSTDSFHIDYSAIDIDGDSLVYSFSPIRSAVNTYLSYNTGHSGANPIPGFAIDANTGVITKTSAATTIGVYYVSVLVKEYDTVTGLFKSEVQKELTVFISNLYSTPSTISNAPTPNGIQSITGATLVSGNTYQTCPGPTINLDISFTGNQQVSLWSDIYQIAFSTFPAATYTVVEGTTSVLSATIPTNNLAPGNYTFYVEAIEDTCYQVYSSLSYEAFTIIINGINAGPDRTICLGDSVQLTASGSNNYSSYQWTAISGPAMNIGTNSSCANCPNPIVYPSATTTYEVTGTGGPSCGTTDTVTVFVDTPVNFNVIGNTNICTGDSVTLDASSSTGPFYWYVGNYSIPFSTDSIVVVSPSANTTYFLVGDSASVCINDDSVQIAVFQNTIASNNVDICEGNSTILSVTGDSSYTWSPTTTLSCSTCVNPTASPLVTTTYIVTSSNTICNNTDSVIVTVHGNTTASNDTTFCDGDSVMLTATGGTTFNWIPTLGLSCSTCPNPYASPPFDMTYIVTSNTNAMCNTVDTVNVYVEFDRVYHGTAYQSSGVVLPNTNVYMIEYNPLDSTVTAIDSVLTDASGYFNFVTPDSLVYLKVTPDSATYPTLIPTYYDGQSLFLNSTSLAANACDSILANITVVQGVNLGGTGFISGNVYQGAGKQAAVGDPVEGLGLILVNEQNKEVLYWKTSSTGYLQFSGLVFGTYYVWADKAGIDNSQAPSIVVNENTKDIDFYFKLNKETLVRTTANSINNLNQDNIKLYPNPANSVISVEINQPFSYIITSLNGSEILRTEELQTENTIDISSLKSGVYLIKVTTSKKVTVLKFIKE